MIVVFIADREDAVVLMLIVKLNLNNLKYLFFLPLWIFTYGILFWVFLDVSFVMQAIIAVTLQQKFYLADKESSSVLKESRTPVKLSCTLFV